MKWNILHESRGRIRLHLRKPRMSLAEADQLQDYLTSLPGVRTAAVYERTCDVVIVYTESRAGIVRGLAAFRFDTEALAEVPANSPRAVNREYQEKLVNMTIFHFARKLFLPAPLRMVYTLVRSVPYIFRGLRCVFRRKLEVEVLDALSIGVSMLRGDFGTAGSVMFLLRLGELLEEWTRKKSLGDLARCMSLNVDRVWQQTAEGEVLVPISQVCAGDAIVVHTGSVIPLDGRVLDGEASVNQASLTGEAEPVRKSEGAVVYAGTVVEEGQITVTVEQQAGNGRYDQIVKMIENSEKLKSASETRAAALADVRDNIVDFKDGYETVLGERGVTVSGGQKQRISIARALLKNAPILILDDSVSAVDTRTEKIILDNLKTSRAGKTTLLIAHRISTVEHLDKIVFIEDGRVEAVGPHDELYRSCAEYRRMVDLQKLEDEEGGGSHG